MLLLGWRCVCSCFITNPGEDVGCKSSCYTLQSTCIYKGTIWFPTMRLHFVNSVSWKTINVEYLQWQKWQTYCRMKIRKHGWRQEIACSNHYINTSNSDKCGEGKHSITKKGYKSHIFHHYAWYTYVKWDYLNGMQRTTNCKCNLCKQMRWNKIYWHLSKLPETKEKLFFDIMAHIAIVTKIYKQYCITLY